MTIKRWQALMHPKNALKLTEKEIEEGWHWCSDCNGWLVGPEKQELMCCKCLPKGHKVYESIIKYIDKHTKVA